MTIDKNLLLKWIEPKTHLENLDLKLVDHCALVTRSETNQVIGMTVFQPRSLNSEFVTRLESRLNRNGIKDHKHSLQLPGFLKSQVRSLKLDAIDGLEIIYSPFMHFQKSEGMIQVRSFMRIVCVDDSPVILAFLKKILEETGFLQVIECVSASETACSRILELAPDAVTMDIQMPLRTGVDVVKEVLAKEYFPIVMVSSLSPEDGPQVFDALQAGAFDYIQKPSLTEKDFFQEDIKNRLLASVSGGKAQAEAAKFVTSTKAKPQVKAYSKNLIWTIGTSTGGPKALHVILTGFPAQVPPTFIVQHIPPSFSKSLAQSLNRLCPFTIKEAENGEIAKANFVYIAPGGTQMAVKEVQGELKILITDEAPLNRFKPSVDFLFNSLCTLKGFEIVAALLTGMGKDGADGLLKLKNMGAQTIAQDESSSVVFGMPRAAIEINAALHVKSLNDLSETFLSLSTAEKRKSA